MSMLDELLNHYPQFLDKNKDSNHYKYHKTLATVLNDYKRSELLVKLSQNLDRPLKLWRQQNQPYEYSICFEASIENVEYTHLYKETAPGSGEYELLNTKEDEFQLEGSYSLQTDSIIPEERFYLEIKTESGFLFQKGFPENDTINGDIFDHDTVLDRLGDLYGIPRRRYNPPKDDVLYSSTTPAYNLSGAEWDYIYQKRIQKNLKSYGRVPLPVLEIERIYGLKASVGVCWDEVARMDINTIDENGDAGYMASTDINSDIYTVKIEGGLPSNLQAPSQEDIEQILDYTMPLGSHQKSIIWEGFFLLN